MVKALSLFFVCVVFGLVTFLSLNSSPAREVIAGDTDMTGIPKNWTRTEIYRAFMERDEAIARLLGRLEGLESLVKSREGNKKSEKDK